MDRGRKGLDRVTDYLEKYDDRLNTGATRDGDSLGWAVYTLEWISYGELLADQLIDLKSDRLSCPPNTLALTSYWISLCAGVNRINLSGFGGTSGIYLQGRRRNIRCRQPREFGGVGRFT